MNLKNGKEAEDQKKSMYSNGKIKQDNIERKKDAFQLINEENKEVPSCWSDHLWKRLLQKKNKMKCHQKKLSALSTLSI